LIYARRLSALPSQRVFAAAAADDQNFHVVPASGGNDAFR
jgi:hypothetical protein